MRKIPIAHLGQVYPTPFPFPDLINGSVQTDEINRYEDVRDYRLGTWSLSPEGSFPARSYQTFTITLTVGMCGVDEGGGFKIGHKIVYDGGSFNFSDPKAKNYIVARPISAQPVKLQLVANDGVQRPWFQNVTVRVRNSFLREGDKVEIVYGDTSGGSPGFLLPSYTESDFSFHVSADVCATGQYWPLNGIPSISVVGAEPFVWKAVLPTKRVVGDQFRLGIKVEDYWGNPTGLFRGGEESGSSSIKILLQTESYNGEKGSVINGLPAIYECQQGKNEQRSFILHGLSVLQPDIVRVCVYNHKGKLLCKTNPLVVGPKEDGGYEKVRDLGIPANITDQGASRGMESESSLLENSASNEGGNAAVESTATAAAEVSTSTAANATDIFSSSVNTSSGGKHAPTPMDAEVVRSFWGDLHGQSGETVGINTIDEYLEFARDLAFLDVSGHQANDFHLNDCFWSYLNEVTKKMDEPGKFVVFPGYEWSGNTPVGGDHNVFYLNEGEQIYRSSYAMLPPPVASSNATIGSFLKQKEGANLVSCNTDGSNENVDYVNVANGAGGMLDGPPGEEKVTKQGSTVLEGGKEVASHNPKPKSTAVLPTSPLQKTDLTHKNSKGSRIPVKLPLPDTSTMKKLYSALKGHECFVYSHVGGRPADVSYAHDPSICTSVEVHSDWGTFEWILWDSFDLRHRVGVVCNSDGHKGQPGASYPGAANFGAYGGLTCFLANTLSRASIYECIKRRRHYGTTGARLDISLYGTFQGKAWRVDDAHAEPCVLDGNDAHSKSLDVGEGGKNAVNGNVSSSCTLSDEASAQQGSSSTDATNPSTNNSLSKRSSESPTQSSNTLNSSRPTVSKIMMGDIVETTDQSITLSIQVFAPTAIERIEVFNGKRLARTLKPFSDNELGNRIRVIWEGAECRGRARKTTWNGKICFTNVKITSLTKLNLWNKELKFISKDELAYKNGDSGALAASAFVDASSSLDSSEDAISHTIEFDASTTGNWGGVDFFYEDISHGTTLEGRMIIDTPIVKADVKLGKIGFEDIVFDAGMLGRKIRVFRLPEVMLSDELSTIIRLPLDKKAKGEDNQLYIKCSTVDGHNAWTSPMYVSYIGGGESSS